MCSRLLASIYAESRQKLAINVFHGGLAKHRRMTTSSSARHYDRVQHDTHNVFLRASVIIGSAASKWNPMKGNDCKVVPVHMC